MTRRYGRHVVEVPRADKVLVPDVGLTKRGVVEYYERIADRLLPHLADRPLVLQRWPDGIRKAGFYQKQAGKYFPDWIDTVTVSVESGRRHQDLVVCKKVATLVYLAGQACLVLHPWLSRVDRLRCPDQLVIDLDPPRNDFEAARRAALQVRRLLDDLDVPSFPKLTGSRGVHVHVPLDRRGDFDRVRAVARSLMRRLAEQHPDELTTEPRKAKRRGRLYLDVARNAYGQTAVAPYSLRARPGAPVATPVSWDELEHAGLDAQSFTVKNIFARLAHRADPWAHWRRRARSIATIDARLTRLCARASI